MERNSWKDQQQCLMKEHAFRLCLVFLLVAIESDLFHMADEEYAKWMESTRWPC